MALASERPLFRIEELLIYAHRTSKIFISRTTSASPISLKYNRRVEHAVLTTAQKTDLHICTQTSDLVSLIIYTPLTAESKFFNVR
jgi:hypothetical protein